MKLVFNYIEQLKKLNKSTAFPLSLSTLGIVATIVMLITMPLTIQFVKQDQAHKGYAAGASAVVVEVETGTVNAPAVVVNDSTASGGQAVDLGPAGCGLSELLVPSCGALLGAFANDYPGTTSFKSDIENHEQRIGKQLTIVHTFHPAGNLPLNNDEKYFISRANTILMTNWKPSNVWRDANGSNASVNAQIDQVADNIKAVAPKKIMLNLYHEPENDVSAGVSCTTLKGTSSGSPADYRAMWQNVHNRFNAKGVTNVVWVMNYMGFVNWDCIVKDMWPGNDLVDWVMYDPYSASNSVTWDSAVGRFYNWLETNSDATHDFKSKPWGLAEFGIGLNADQAHTYKFYDDAKAALDANRYPRLKAYVNFDSQGVHDTQIQYVTQTHVLDNIEQEHYKSFSNHPTFSLSRVDSQAAGTVTSTIDVVSTGTYRLWTSLFAPEATNNSFTLQVDGGTPIVVGDNASAIPANVWTWVNFQNSSRDTPIDIPLTQGPHTFTITARESGVKVDRLLVTTDKAWHVSPPVPEIIVLLFLQIHLYLHPQIHHLLILYPRIRTSS